MNSKQGLLPYEAATQASVRAWGRIIRTLWLLSKENRMDYAWHFDQKKINWVELSELYKIAPLGTKLPDDLELVFSNSKFKCFVYRGKLLIGAGRALADGKDCSYICDIAIHPAYQGRGLGKQIVENLVRLSRGHKKIILYANPGKEGFYAALGFKRMNTAMAIFQNETEMLENGTISEP
ncbi:MAG: GNAT family N-acetyltransferase [Pedobacter sp.]